MKLKTRFETMLVWIDESNNYSAYNKVVLMINIGNKNYTYINVIKITTINLLLDLGVLQVWNRSYTSPYVVSAPKQPAKLPFVGRTVDSVEMYGGLEIPEIHTTPQSGFCYFVEVRAS